MKNPFHFVCVSVLLSLFGCQEVESGFGETATQNRKDLPVSIEVKPLFPVSERGRFSEIVSLRPIDERTLGFLELVNRDGTEDTSVSSLNFGTLSIDGVPRRHESKESTWFLDGRSDELGLSAWAVEPTSQDGRMEFNLEKHQLISNRLEVGLSQTYQINPLFLDREGTPSRSESVKTLKKLEPFYVEREFVPKYRLAGHEFRLSGSPNPFLWFVLDKESFILDSNSGKQHYVRPFNLTNATGPRIAFCQNSAAKAFFALIGSAKEFNSYSSFVSGWKELRSESREELVVVSFDGSQLRYEFGASVPQNLDYGGSIACAGEPESAFYVSAPTAPSENTPSKIWVKALIRDGARAQLFETQVLSSRKSRIAGLRYSPKHKRVIAFGRADFGQAPTGSVSHSKGFILILDSLDLKASQMRLINGKRSVSINDAAFWDSQNGSFLMIAGTTNAPDTHDFERGASPFVHKLSFDLQNNNNLKGRSP